jgi:hypothetical protein
MYTVERKVGDIYRDREIPTIDEIKKKRMEKWRL